MTDDMHDVRGRTLAEVCGSVQDPRTARVNKFDFQELLFAAMASLLGGAATLADTARLAKENLDWLRQHLPYPNGAPSATTFHKALARLEPQEARILMEWMERALDTLRSRGALLPDMGAAAEPESQDGTPRGAIGVLRAVARPATSQVSAATGETVAPSELMALLDENGCLVPAGERRTDKRVPWRTESIRRKRG